MKRWFIVGIIILILIPFMSWGWRYYTASIKGRVGAEQQIQSPGLRISAYNYFFNLYAAIQSYDISLEALEDNLAKVNSEDERERVLASIAGLKSQRARAIAQYNADARKEYTIGQFRDVGLPYQIEQK